MRKLTLLLVAFVFMTSCSNTKREYSDILHEKAVVVTLIYSPSEHHTNLTNTMMDDPINSMIGIDMNGNKGIKIGGGMQMTNTTIPEKYGVAFQCQHGTFTVEGNAEKYKTLYLKMYGHTGDTVDILYKEEYLATYDDTNDDGKDELVSRTLLTIYEFKLINDPARYRVLDDLDFIDAQTIKNK